VDEADFELREEIGVDDTRTADDLSEPVFLPSTKNSEFVSQVRSALAIYGPKVQSAMAGYGAMVREAMARYGPKVREAITTHRPQVRNAIVGYGWLPPPAG